MPQGNFARVQWVAKRKKSLYQRLLKGVGTHLYIALLSIKLNRGFTADIPVTLLLHTHSVVR